MAQEHRHLPIGETVTKEQRLELVRHRLVPGDRIPLMSRREAEAILRKHRTRSFVRGLVRSVVILVVLALVGFGGLQGWKWWEQSREEPPPPPPPPPVVKKEPAKVESVWTVGAWERWIDQDRFVLVVKRLPGAVRGNLKEQSRLFAGVLESRSASPPDPEAWSAAVEEWKSVFPDGNDVRVSYSTSRSTSHASASQASASIRPSNRYFSSGSKGVMVAYRDRYGALVRQIREDTLVAQLEDLNGRLERDIADMESRRGADGGMAAQRKATLQWLEDDVGPYLRDFLAFARSPKDDEENSAIEAWIEFEAEEKPGMESVIDDLLVERIPLDGDIAMVPPGAEELLLEGRVGGKKMIFLPGYGGEVKVDVID